MVDNNPDIKQQKKANHSRDLLRREGTRSKASAGYSKIIRYMRLALPVVAVVIVAVLFVFSGQQDITIEIEDDAARPVISAKVGRNELLSPKFESRDQKGQPYTVTADRAFQGSGNENLVILENPFADMLLSSGHWAGAKADRGGFRQDTQRLFLNGNVQLFEDQGYHLLTDELHVNLQQNLVWTDIDVSVQGPDAYLEAKGMTANQGQEIIRFTGPAILTLTGIDGGLGAL